MRATVAARIALGSLLALGAIAAFAQSTDAAGPADGGPLPDVSGVYRTRHPNDEWGEVLVRFDPMESRIQYQGADYPAWAVSIWKDSGGNRRKLRDGLFGSYVEAAVVRRDGSPAFLWRSRDGARDRFNKIVSIAEGGVIEIGSPDSEDSGERVYNRLEYESAPDWSSGGEAPRELAGVYDYYSDATGRVTVAFSPTESRIPVGPDASIEAWTVRIVRDLGESRFAVVREGIFGGSRPRDEYTLVGVDRADGGAFLVWYDPRRPRETRRNRIVCAYGNGDIGIGLGEGELEYVEDSLFRKIAGPEARIGDALGFIDPAGIYDVETWPGSTAGSEKVLARIAPTAVRLGDRPIFRLETIDLAEGRAVVRHRGLGPSDPFGHVAVGSKSGACRLSFIDFASGREEEFEVFDLGLDGSFSLARTSERRAGSPRAVVARFERRADARGSSPDSAAEGSFEAVASWRLELEEKGAATWTEDEASAFEAAASILPPDFFGEGRIAVVRDSGLFTLGGDNGGGALVAASKGRRELRVKRLEVAEGYPVDAGEAREAYLLRALVHALALLKYEELDSSRRSEWASFNLWKSSLLAPPESLNKNPEGFADPIGRTSPAEDFASFAEDVFLRPAYKDPMSAARLRMPDRYAFFRSLFPSIASESGAADSDAAGADASAPAVRAESFRDWIDPDEVERLELVVTTPTSTSIESIAGHVLLLVKRKGDYEDCGDSLVLGFVGEIARDKANGVRGLAYVFRGLTGYYRSLIQEETFESLARRATLVENRDVLRLRLRMSRAEIERLIERLWVLKRTFTYKYYFFTGNCVSMLLDALDFAFIDGRKIRIGGIVAPMYVVARLAYAGRIEGFSYPERWSILRTARYASEMNREAAREMASMLDRSCARARELGTSGGFDAVRTDAAAALAVLQAKGEGAVVADPLFRTPVIALEGPDRGAAYRRLAGLCDDLRAARGDVPGAMADEEFLRYVELTERFLLRSMDRELYVAVPAELEKGYGKDDVALMENLEEIAERRLYRVRSRQENSAEIQAIQLAISSLRRSMEVVADADALATLGRKMRDERDERAAADRKDAGFTQGYYAKGALASWRIEDGRPIASLGWESALYRGEMGDGSFCSLKRDMRLVLLDGKIEAGYAIDGDPSRFEAAKTSARTSGVAAEMERISTGSDADYRGFLSLGFGIAAMRSSGILWDGERLFPRRDMILTILEARVLLNVFEIDDFRHYLNVGAGAGIQKRSDDGAGSWNATVPVGLDAKFRLPGLSGNALRVRADWETRFPFAGAPASALTAEAELMVSLDRLSNAGIGARASVVVEDPASWSASGPKRRELEISLVYRP